MAIYPVILSGGAGTRLWPASRDHRPKQFLSLAGETSLFQETVARVAPLTGDNGRILVVAGRDHAASIAEQLGEVAAVLLIEPAGRDSAPAMAAAAEWIARRDPDGVALFVASDHHIPDAAGFRASVIEGARAAAAGRIVTFGVRPSEPSSAYGYIQPEGPGLAPVRRFVEKPDRQRAEAYVAEGYYWNSGNFVVRADVLLTELERFAPEVLRAARAALPDDDGAALTLTDAFNDAPRISIDYAVLEKSERVSVLPVEFGWSDLGAWDAVAATGGAGRGRRDRRRRTGSVDRGPWRRGQSGPGGGGHGHRHRRGERSGDHRRAGRRPGLPSQPIAGGEGPGRTFAKTVARACSGRAFRRRAGGPRTRVRRMDAFQRAASVGDGRRG